MASDSPAVAQMKLAARLRELRTAAGMTIEQAAAELLCSMATVSRTETGDRLADGRTVRSMCLVYGADQATAAELLAAVRRGREKDPWRIEPISNDRSVLYLSLEQNAESLVCLARDVIPALLRTANYDQAAGRPYPQVREARQVLVGKIPTTFLLDEAVLQRHPGADIMADQLGHILNLAGEGAIVRVVPFRAALISSPAPNFTILDFAGELPPMVFSEREDRYQDHTADLDRFRAQADWLQSIALNAPQSLALIEEMRKAF